MRGEQQLRIYSERSTSEVVSTKPEQWQQHIRNLAASGRSNLLTVFFNLEGAN
jgi:hypothetical protein